MVTRRGRKLRDPRLFWTGEIPCPVAVDAPPPVRSLTAESFDVVFQPIVELKHGRVRALEALVRCRVDAYRNPEELFRSAVDESSVGRLGRTIREVTFERCAGRDVYINIHPEELRSRWLVRPDDPICMHDAEVYLEITESAALDYYDLCSSVLRELCARTGAHLVVDDLGAGYSNLKRVIDLEPRVVKLDRALIRGIDSNRRQRILVEQLVKTCEALDALVVAEGIETVEELKAVREAGAALGQGYLLARPAYPPCDAVWPV